MFVSQSWWIECLRWAINNRACRMLSYYLCLGFDINCISGICFWIIVCNATAALIYATIKNYDVWRFDWEFPHWQMLRFDKMWIVFEFTQYLQLIRDFCDMYLAEMQIKSRYAIQIHAQCACASMCKNVLLCYLFRFSIILLHCSLSIKNHEFMATYMISILNLFCTHQESICATKRSSITFWAALILQTKRHNFTVGLSCVWIW